MDNQECNEVYERLMEMLAENKLDWIVEQVNQQVQLGKTIIKETETLKHQEKEFSQLYEDDVYIPKVKKGPKAKFPVTEDYTPNEKLNLLLDAIEQAIVNTAEMENHLIEYFDSSLKKWDGIDFYADEPESQPISLNLDSVLDRYDSSQNLKIFIDELRGVI